MKKQNWARDDKQLGMSGGLLDNIVCYVTPEGTISQGILVEAHINLVTGKQRLRLVDSHQQLSEPDAGFWIDAEACLGSCGSQEIH